MFRRAIFPISLFLVIMLLLGMSITVPSIANGAKLTSQTITSITTNLADYPFGQVPRYEKFEINSTLSASYVNPFNPNEVKVDGYFISPSNNTLVQPGFYYQNYSMTVTGSTETYSPIGNPVWKVRFTPQEVGTYQYYVKVTDITGTVMSGASSFQVVDTGNQGFIRVSDTNSRYFAYEDGSPFIGVGLNVAWWQFENQRISTYQYYLDRMSEYKANLARVWMTNSGKDQNWIMSIQDKTLGGNYNLEKAWAFDQILEMARQNGVHFLLTLDDVNQYTYNWPINLYNSAMGGPCAYPACIFTDATASQFQQRILRYIVARWGYSTSIFSWELFNEINELEWSTSNWNWCQVVVWHRAMAQYITSIDAQNHLVNSSTGSFKTFGGTCGTGPNLYSAPEMKFAEIHYYYVPGCCGWAPSDPAGQDMANLTRYYSYLVYNSVSNKPSIIGEWGLVNQNWVDSPYLLTDDKGVHLHNGLWSSIMSGMAATGLNWHWGYHQEHDPSWWQHYLGIANYLENIGIADLTVMKPVNVDFSLPNGSDNRPAAFLSSSNKLRAMGLKGSSIVYAWIQNTDNTWWNYVNGSVTNPQSGTITIYALASGVRYYVEWWDTYTGKTTKTDIVTAQSDGSIQVTVQNLSNDVAIKVRRVNTFLQERLFLPLLHDVPTCFNQPAECMIRGIK